MSYGAYVTCGPFAPGDVGAHTENIMKTTLMCGAGALASAILLTAAAHADGILTAKNGMTLYIFDKDVGSVSSCYNDCAKNWPPYLGKEGDAMTEHFVLAKRTDGAMQWTYDGKPLYFFAGDKVKNDKAGDGKGGVWHIVAD
jgi:predicted lipoprotein with Yx(FWY)xxD motif